MSRFHGVDPLEALAALNVKDVSAVQPVSGGMDTLIYRVDTAHATYALRLFRPDQGDQCSHEIRAMQLVGRLGVPAPRIVAHGIWGDRPAILMEWYEGRTVFDQSLAHPELIEPLGLSMGRLLARLHAVSVPTEYWEDHRSWLSMAGPDEVELTARLRELGLRDGRILHLDFHPLNILCVGQEATVILDWANVAVGDTRADVARTMSILRLVSPPPAVSAPDFYSLRMALERAWIEGYTQIAGPLPDLTLFEIWAGVAFIRDMEKKIGMPEFWMAPADFDRLRSHVATLKRRAGLSENAYP